MLAIKGELLKENLKTTI